MLWQYSVKEMSQLPCIADVDALMKEFPRVMDIDLQHVGEAGKWDAQS